MLARHRDAAGTNCCPAFHWAWTMIVRAQRLPFQPSPTPYADAIREAEAEPAIKARDVDELMDLIDRA